MTHLVVVLGMHRSGTSVVARSLQCLGVDLGARAVWSALDNPRGFWEHQDILAINETILKEIGVSWDDPSPWTKALASFCRVSFRAQQLSYIARRILSTEMEKSPLFGIKEPRLCRLLPFWRPILDAMGCQVSVVHVVRHPATVAASLLRRNGLPIERGVALWGEYVRHQFADVDPEWPSVVVGYDEMMILPQQQIARIGAALGLTADPEKTLDFAQRFIDTELRHETPSDDIPIPTEIRMMWETANWRAGL